MARAVAVAAYVAVQGRAQLTGSPTPAPPAPQVPGTPAPTWSTDDAQAHYVQWEEHCELNLNYDECFAFATSEGLDFDSQPEANQGLPSGCFRQYPDSVVVFNQQANFQYIPMADNGLCPRAEVTIPGSDLTPYVECYLKMVCREPDFDQMEEGEFCGENQGLTQSECEAIGGAHGQSGGFQTFSNMVYPKGCSLDIEQHYTMYNAHPIGLTDMASSTASPRTLCSQDTGPTDAPTPEPTPMPTPAPTITPTWAEELDTYMADWGHGCNLNLNKEECAAWAAAKNVDFETRDQADLPRACWQQHPDEVVIFNAYSVWSPADEALEPWCDIGDVDPSVMDKPCWARMLCRREDWFSQQGYCQAGTGVPERECKRIGAAHDRYNGYSEIRTQDFPAGCIGMKLPGQEHATVTWNAHSSGGGHRQALNKGYESFCKKPAHRCAARDDGLDRNKWCQKKCNKKRKKACNARCDRKCIDTCKCNTKCADSETWIFNDFVQKSVMKDGWYNERNCAWVAADPDARCKEKGMDNDKEMIANSACPTACGKCKTEERRLSSKVMIV